MSPRIRLGIIILVVVLAVAGGVFLFYQSTPKNGGLFSNRTVTPNAPEPTTTGRFIDSSNFSTSSLTAVTLPANSLPTPEPTTTSAAAPLAIEKKGVERFARVFAEIYGSFSSDNNYQNVLDVRSLVSPQLWEKIKPPTSPKPASSFVGVTTQVLVTTLSDWTATSARVDVTAQRTENKAGKTSTYQQKATVLLVKQGSNWLVDGFVWAKP